MATISSAMKNVRLCLIMVILIALVYSLSHIAPQLNNNYFNLLIAPLLVGLGLWIFWPYVLFGGPGYVKPVVMLQVQIEGLQVQIDILQQKVSALEASR